MRTLLDTTSTFDAGLLGYDGACDPSNDGEGLVVTASIEGVPEVLLRGPEGEVRLAGEAEIRIVAETLNGVLAIKAANGRRAA